MQTMLQVENLTRQYPDFTLDHVSFQIAGGTIMGLVGENGAGKSTTIRAILGLIRRDAGTVTFCGKPLTTDSRELKAQIGVVFDSLAFYEGLTVEQALSICSMAYSNWDEEWCMELMRRFQLKESQKIKELSRGMKMKLSLVMAMAHRPKLLLLDEPTGGLDPVVRDDLLELFLEFVQDEEHAILMSSHITTDLEKVADYVTFLHDGKILLSQSKDDLIYQYGILRCGKPVFDSLSASEMLAWRKRDYAWDVLVPNREEAQRRHRDAVVDPATLDEILLLYVKGEQVL